MNFARFKTQLYIILYGHVLNWPWRSGEKRREFREEAIRTAVTRYVDRYSYAYANLPEDIPSDDNDEETVFSIWLQGEDKAPEIVKACFRSIRANFSHKLTVLDRTSVFDYISLPQYIVNKWESGKMRPAHFTDICRVELLYRYGGIWIDSTAFATGDIPDRIMDENFFIYRSGSKLHGFHSFVQNCFFRSRRHNYILKCWRAAIYEYWRHENSVVDYFVHQMLLYSVVRNNAEAGRQFRSMPQIDQDPTHALWWTCRDLPFDKEIYDRLTSGTFFQKTEYKSNSAVRPIPGSFSDVMRKMYNNY